MKEKCINGKVIKYAESAREMRAMLPAEYQHQLMVQPGSAIAICTANNCNSNLHDFCLQLNRSGKFVSYYYADRRAFLRESNFRILISHRTDNGKYSLIGGARKLCESFEETAYRELGEESGLNVSDLLFLGLTSGGNEMVNIYPDGNAAEGIDALYLAMLPVGSITRPNAETREFIWMTPDEISAAIYMNKWHSAQVKTIKKLLSSLLQLPEIYSLQQDAPTW